MNGAQLAALLDRAMPFLAESKDELRDLDAAIGDGDLGITVSKGALAVRKAVAEVEEPTPSTVLRAAGTAAATANPSTMGALAGGGLLAAAKAVADCHELTRADVVALARAAADSIRTRGKAQVGDKTILDALVPSIDTLEREQAADALPAMIDTARRAVADTAALQSRRGRAAWVGERSVGRPDPGATAYLRLLEALARAQQPSSE